MVSPAGIEPATLCLEGRCSIQLSYGLLEEIVAAEHFNLKFEKWHKACPGENSLYQHGNDGLHRDLSIAPSRTLLLGRDDQGASRLKLVI